MDQRMACKDCGNTGGFTMYVPTAEWNSPEQAWEKTGNENVFSPDLIICDQCRSMNIANTCWDEKGEI